MVVALVTLAELLANATPGPWEYQEFDGVVIDPEGVLVSGPPRDADARLIALAPDLARLALDMGEALIFYRQAYGHLWSVDELADNGDLLARLDGIGT